MVSPKADVRRQGEGKGQKMRKKRRRRLWMVPNKPSHFPYFFEKSSWCVFLFIVNEVIGIFLVICLFLIAFYVLSHTSHT